MACIFIVNQSAAKLKVDPRNIDKSMEQKFEVFESQEARTILLLYCYY